MKKIVSLLLALAMLLSLTSAFAEETAPLQFKEDGTFKIMILADTHVGHEGHHIGDKMKEYFHRVLEANRPDLIVLLGDNVNGNGYTMEEMTPYIEELMALLDPLGIPVAMVLGNHEDNLQSACPTKEEQMAVYEKYACFVGGIGVSANNSVGNYNLPILSSDGSRNAYNLWFFDNTSSALPAEVLNWYVATSDALKAENGGAAVPSIAFQHIIPSQIYELVIPDESAKAGYILPEGGIGVLGEKPVPYADTTADVNTFLQQGDVVAIAVGHDHANDFIVDYKGIDFINVPGWSKLGSYCGPTVRGIGFIDLNESDLTTYGYYTVRPQDLGEMWFYGYALPGMTITTVQ